MGLCPLPEGTGGVPPTILLPSSTAKEWLPLEDAEYQHK